jgi:hypothetical protein|tara:strand:- start:34340 stop:34579 length:240 start_codon:yes stop_codon:yes gene_type:complete
MRPTQKQLTLKLKEVEQFEKDWGECTRSKAMKKYCTDKKYRKRVQSFNQSVIQTYFQGLRNPERTWGKQVLNENDNYEI